MGTDLNVLTTSVTAASTLLAPYREKLEAAAIACVVVEVNGKHEPSLIRYLNSNSRVTFIVSSGVDDPVQSLIASGNGRRALGTPPIPIVMVAGETAS